MELAATFSECRKYRYSLLRRFNGNPLLMFVMLNPSTADETRDDPTIRRCIGFALNMGYGGAEIFNLFGYRSTDPKKLLTVHDPVGPDNNRIIMEAARNRIDPIVCAWGKVYKTLDWRPKFMIAQLRNFDLRCLKKNKEGSPAHPLYLHSKLRLVKYP